MRMIDADDLEEKMYHEAFEKDSDMQKWDSGCWIRYKLFENVLKEQPTIQPETTRRIVGKSKGGMTLWYECERCGKPVDEGDKFCRGCGAKMEVTT